MPHVYVENVSLTFPLYSANAVPTTRSGKDDAPNIIRNKSGRLIGVKSLTDVDLELNSGDRLAIIGANGSGKTTLLQVLAGIYPPDEGYVEIRGTCTNLININLGMQADVTGNENIMLRGLAAGHRREEIEEQREQIAEFSQLGEFLDMPVRTYSAGMQIRLSFAIATAFKPEILLLDEWLSAGDAAFKARAVERMNSFVSEAGILVLASHSKALLQANCNRAIWLERGRVRAKGEVENIWDAYIEDQAKRRA
ncbi:MAG: ABC transporter ATP-binding protein [Hyphomonas sp.]|nr:ABC transporter ATP-binding protein [Hyphomonas sp.]